MNLNSDFLTPELTCNEEKSMARTLQCSSQILGIAAMRRKIIEGGGVMVKSERQVAADSARWNANRKTWLPDGYSHIFRSYIFGPSGFWTMAPLRYAAQFDPFLSLDCAPTPTTLAQSKERKGSNFAIWQPWDQGV